MTEESVDGGPMDEGSLGPLQEHLQHLTLEALRGEAVGIVEAMLADAAQLGASDVHCDRDESGLRVRFRIDGVLHEAAYVPRQQSARVLNRLKALAGIDPTTIFHPEGSRWTHELGDGGELELRLTIVPMLGGEKVALRLLYPERVERYIADLGMADAQQRQLRDYLTSISGMFLCVGPTGCGKTTTVYSLLHELAEQGQHIVSVEDPAEYSITGITQIQVDPEHGLDFADGIRAAHRLDPDGIFIGELREAATAHAAIETAVNGGVVLATMHAKDATAAISRLRHWGVRNHEIVAGVTGIISQRLVRTLCGECCARGPAGAGLATWLQALGQEVGELWLPQGCDACSGLGYHGRTGVFETWHLEHEDYERILADCDEHRLRRALVDAGHHFLIDDALGKAEAGLTTYSEVRSSGVPLQA